MADEYYKALGAYTHHLNEALKKGNEYRSIASDVKLMAERVTATPQPYTEYNLPPAIDGNKLLSLSKELVRLNDEIDHHINEANLYAKEAKKETLERKKF